ncbi:uncharacterized protein LOC143223567 isoform X2 [Tachypleus tridentatus]|uniref:uncharacterized protein LOC143223567 isoform X2 n=1 Tax=Tachypleus tridentatus TaxID=6853 RepID=UPI003FD13B70
MNMEVVRAFNNELSSLYESKPPVSKAKMTQVTKAAIKGIKFYKHIVQSVEKFIQKCRPEYKVPGLYVIDSIVRQSRHQFGDKDVFAPRFSKNITTTFQNLFKCPDEDRSKVVRVLNLWQKNSVFQSEIIQPLLDLADPNNTNSNQSPVANEGIERSTAKLVESPSWKGWSQSSQGNQNFTESRTIMHVDEDEKQDTTVLEDEAENSISQQASNMDLLSHLQQLATTLAGAKPDIMQQEENIVKFNKKLLDFDYGDEEEEDEKQDETSQSSEPNALALSMAQNLLSNPELLQQLQQMQQTIQQNDVFKTEFLVQEGLEEQKELSVSQQIPQQSTEHAEPTTVFGTNCLSYIPEPPPQFPTGQESANRYPPLSYEPPPLPPSSVNSEQDDSRHSFGLVNNISLPLEDQDERQRVAQHIGVEDKDDRERSGSRSRSPSRSSKSRSSRRHSRRSRSRSPRRRRSRSGSRSRSRHKRERRSRSRSRERERERERERRKKGLPPLKKNYLCVCSTTLWLGHVPKIVSEADIHDVFAEFGTIASIDMIPPRGCAYVCMDRRQDAYKALQSLKNLKLQGSSIKMAWAPGKGMKGKEYKDYWEVDVGVSYIPYDKLPETVDLDSLEEGGVIDEQSVPSNLKEQQRIRQKEKEEALKQAKEEVVKNQESAANQSVANLVPGLPSINMQMVPQMVQPQFGIPVPGMVPAPSMVIPQLQIPVGAPRNPVMMMSQNTQPVVGGHSLTVMGGLPPVPSMAPVSITSDGLQLQPFSTAPNVVQSTHLSPSTTNAVSQAMDLSGDATPTEEEGTCLPIESNNTDKQPTTITTTSGDSSSGSSLPHIPSLSNTMPTVSSVDQIHTGVPPPVQSTIPRMPFLPPVGSFQPLTRPSGHFQGGALQGGPVPWGTVASQLPQSTSSTGETNATATVAVPSQFGSPRIPYSAPHPPVAGLGSQMAGPYQGQGHNSVRIPNPGFFHMRHPSPLSNNNSGQQQQSGPPGGSGVPRFLPPRPNFQPSQFSLPSSQQQSETQEKTESDSVRQQNSPENERKVLLSPPQTPLDFGPRPRGPAPPEQINFPSQPPLLSPVRGPPPPRGFSPYCGPRPRMDFNGPRPGMGPGPRGPPFGWNRPRLNFGSGPDRMGPRPGFPPPREFFDPRFGRPDFKGRLMNDRENIEQRFPDHPPFPKPWERNEVWDDHDWQRERGRTGLDRERDYWRKDRGEYNERDHGIHKDRDMDRDCKDRERSWEKATQQKHPRERDSKEKCDHDSSKSGSEETSSTHSKPVQSEENVKVQENGENK